MRDFTRFKSLMGWTLVAAMAAFPAAVGCDSDDDGGTGGSGGTGGIRATGGNGGLGGRGGSAGSGGFGNGGSGGFSTGGSTTGGSGGTGGGAGAGGRNGGAGGSATGGIGGRTGGSNGGNGPGGNAGNGGRGGFGTGGVGTGGATGGVGGTGGFAGAGGVGGLGGGGQGGLGGAGGANLDILTDGQVLAVLLDANNGELRTTDIASTRAQDNRVRDFATELRGDHSGAVMRLNSLASDENLTGSDSATRQVVALMGAAAAESLWMATPTAFDNAFVQAQISLHTSVLGAIDQVLLPSTSSAALRAEINRERTAVATHLAHAQTLSAALNGGAGTP